MNALRKLFEPSFSSSNPNEIINLTNREVQLFFSENTSIFHEPRKRKRMSAPSPPPKRIKKTMDIYQYGLENGIKLLLIFNMNKFLKYKEREGSCKDVENLQRVFGKLGFKIELHVDCNKESVENKLEEIRTNKNGLKISLLMVIFMSHGDGSGSKNFITSDEKSMNLKTEVMTRLNDLNCPSLKGIPKVVVGVFCRTVSEEKPAVSPDVSTKFSKMSIDQAGDSKLTADATEISDAKINFTNTDARLTDSEVEDLEVDALTMPCLSSLENDQDFSDFMILLSCKEGRFSNRCPLKGTIFIQAFCDVVEKFSKNRDMNNIFCKIQKTMRRMSPPDPRSLEGFEPDIEVICFETLFLE
ncbi:caspase-6 [Hyalella azteca]|uniref:Caspase-6 n=1 Tax=Hyalella azteca TaxID=294128 RepID=A0A8B7PJW7_HYAAZ|nr:caspase-6 [Hyalella azteca]